MLYTVDLLFFGLGCESLEQNFFSIISVHKDLIAIKSRCQERGYASFMPRADVLGVNEFNVGEWA